MQDLHPVNLLSSKYRFVEKAQIGTKVGNESISLLRYRPLDGQNVTTSGQNVTYHVNNDSFMDSDVRTEMEYNFNISTAGADLDTATLLPQLNNKFGLNSFPCNRIMSNVSVRLNNTSQYSTNVSNILDDYLCNEDPYHLASLSSAAKLDNYFSYGANVLSNVLRAPSDTIDSIDSRGLMNYNVQFTDNPAGGAYANAYVTCTITVQEAIIARPFQYHAKSPPNPFFNVNDLYVTVKFDDLSQFLAYQAGIAVGGKAIVVDGISVQPQLLIRSYSPMVQVPRPKRCLYNSPIIQKYEASRTPNIAGGASREVTFPNYVINGMPKMFCIYAKGPRDVNNAVNFGVITKVSVSIGNHVNQLQDLSTVNDIYNLSVKNGFNNRFSSFSGTPGYPLGGAWQGTNNAGNGSVLYFAPQDLALNMLEQSNSAGVYNITIKFTFMNPTATAQAYTPCLSVIYDNVITFEDGVFSDSMPLLSSEAIASAPLEFTDDEMKMNSILGGSFWNSIWNGIKNFAKSDAGKSVSKMARNSNLLNKYVGDNSAIGKLIKPSGYGKKSAKAAGSLVTIGGRKLSKAELLKSL